MTTYHLQGVRIIEEGLGPIILLLHPAGQPPEGFKRHIQSLSSHNRIIAPSLFDLAKKTHGGNLKQMAVQLNNLLSEVKEYKLVVGCSLGGGVALAFASQFPNKAKRLIICNSVGWPFSRPLKSWVSSHFKMLRQEFKFRHLKEPANKSYQLMFKETIKNPLGVWRAFKVGMQADLKQELSSIKAKVRIIWGSHDQFVPFEYAKLLVSTLPNATLEVVPNPSHYWYDLQPSLLVDRIKQELLKSQTRES